MQYNVAYEKTSPGIIFDNMNTHTYSILKRVKAE